MVIRHSGSESGGESAGAAEEAGAAATPEVPRAAVELLDSEAESSARRRLFDEVLASVELVLVADGTAFWREEPDHTLVLTASRSLSPEILDAFDRNVTAPLQSIMQRWPESPLVAVPLNDPTNAIAEEIRQFTDREGIVGLAGVPCRVPGEMLGVLIVVHRRPRPWTVRDLGLATGLAGQLATAMQNARLYASVRSLANRLAAIHELSLRLNQLRDVEAIGEAIVSEVGRLVDCDTVRVYRVDPGGTFRPVAVSGSFVGIDTPPLEALTHGHTETLPAWVARRNEPLIIADASVERRSILRSTFGPESLLLAPMSYGDSVEGVLVVSKEGAGQYGTDDERALSIFARYAGQAMANAGNIAELGRQHALLEQQVAAARQLLVLSEQLVSTLDPRRVLDQIAETIGTVVPYDRLTIYTCTGPDGGIEPVLSRRGSAEGDDAQIVDQSFDEGLTSWVIGRGDAVRANDVRDEVLAVGPDAVEVGSDDDSSSHVAREARPTQSIIVVPLRVRGEVVGSLNLARIGGTEARFGDHEFELAKLFAGQASIALQNAEAHVTVAHRADLDSLTGLRNHGTFQRDLAAMIEAGEPFSLLMMDLDSFKSFNDTYGHPAGDMLLATVARAIVSATRQRDRAYRYGGDEFAVLLYGAAHAHAGEVSNRIRAAVAAGVQTTFTESGDVTVTASVGAAHWPADGGTQEGLVEAADAALYRAKRRRTETHGLDVRESPPSPHSGASSIGLADAARDLILANSPERVAAAMVCAVVGLCPGSDAFVALADDLGVQAEAVLVPSASKTASGALAVGTSSLVQVAASGAFVGKSQSVRRGGGLWGRVWQGAKLASEDDGNAVRIGAPLLVSGVVIGILGVVEPSQTKRLNHSGAIAQVADLGSAALQRMVGPAD
jgi:diguanylate cyclase (GGDEF)-like protein